MFKRKNIVSIPFILGGITWFCSETIKTVLFGLVGKKITDYFEEKGMTYFLDISFEYGIPVILVVIGLYLWLVGLYEKKVKSKQDKEQKRQLQPVLEEVQTFYNTYLKPAAESGGRVLQRVLFSIRSHAEKTVSSHEELIQSSIFDQERAAFSKINNALTGATPIISIDELQDHIADYYRAYQGMRTWVSQGGKMAGFAFKNDIIFQDWLQLDEQFLTALRQFTGPQQYDRLREKVNGVGWGETISHALRSQANKV